MKHLFALALGAALLISGPPSAFCDAAHYTNSSGHCVKRPVHANRAPTGATARCADGTFSFSEHHRGTCSHHGGVALWLS
jgi:hypothetical protein